MIQCLHIFIILKIVTSKASFSKYFFFHIISMWDYPVLYNIFKFFKGIFQYLLFQSENIIIIFFQYYFTKK